MLNGEFEEQIVKEGGRGNCGQNWSLKWEWDVWVALYAVFQQIM